MPTDELPSHGHTATIASSGDHNHGITTGNNTDAPYSMVSTQARFQNTTRYTNNAGTHSHTVTISTTGGNQSHENRQPYIVIYRYRRTA